MFCSFMLNFKPYRWLKYFQRPVKQHVKQIVMANICHIQVDKFTAMHRQILILIKFSLPYIWCEVNEIYEVYHFRLVSMLNNT